MLDVAVARTAAREGSSGVQQVQSGSDTPAARSLRRRRASALRAFSMSAPPSPLPFDLHFASPLLDALLP